MTSEEEKEAQEIKPEATFHIKEVEAFMNSQVWQEIEAMWRVQEKVIIGHLCDPDSPRDDDQYHKGQLNLVHFNLNLKNILTADLTKESFNDE